MARAQRSVRAGRVSSAKSLTALVKALVESWQGGENLNVWEGETLGDAQALHRAVEDELVHVTLVPQPQPQLSLCKPLLARLLALAKLLSVRDGI